MLILIRRTPVDHKNSISVHLILIVIVFIPMRDLIVMDPRNFRLDFIEFSPLRGSHNGYVERARLDFEACSSLINSMINVKQ